MTSSSTNFTTRIFCALLGLALLFAFGPKLNDEIDELIGSLEQWTTENPQEKIYLHTDKPYYLVGDTIWMKAYLTAGGQNKLSALSGAIYIDMISEGDSITQSLKLPVIAGMATASIILHDSISREGNYRIRAYTQWMRNAGPDYFYDRTFSVGNAVTNNVFAKIEYLQILENGKKVSQARITYTDEKGNPYVDKTVSYAWKDSYKVVSSGGGKTGASGELLIKLPAKPADSLHTRHLMSNIRISENYSISKNFPMREMAESTDVQFFPEGGTLISGLRNRIAFKALASTGLGSPVKGIVLDQQNQEITSFEASHLGMGAFYMIPESGGSYHAKCTFADGSERTIALPRGADKGYLLSVFSGIKRDSVLVRISTNSTTLAEGKQLSLIGQQAGIPYFAINIPIRQQITSLYFKTADVPTGIMQFTLFREGQPVCERLSFIESNDKIDLQVKGPPQAVNKRSEMDLKVEARTPDGKPLAGNFSMSVVSESAVPSEEANENSIFAQLLLSADIKGYIERPNYYFHQPTGQTRANLDLLMMTQGYRRFSWKQIMDKAQPKPLYSVEPLVDEVSGKLLTLGNKPVKDGKVTLINNRLGLILDTVSQDDGAFKFGNLLITQGINFTVQGKTAKGKSRLQVLMNKVTPQPVTPNKNKADVNTNITELIKVSLENSRQQEMQLEKFGLTSRNQQLREVQIRASRPWTTKNRINDSQAEEVFRPDPRRPCKTLLECLTESDHTRLKFQQRLDESEVGCGAVWVAVGYVVLIDDMLIPAACDYQDLLLEEASDIDKIQIVHDGAVKGKLLAPYLSHPLVMELSKGRLPGVIAIYTKSGNFRKAYDPSIVYYSPKGYDQTKEFYAPKYDVPERNHPLADLRTTIYWNPAVLTRGAGQTSVRYFNADQTGSYRVIVEGIDAEGRLGRAVYRYKVE